MFKTEDKKRQKLSSKEENLLCKVNQHNSKPHLMTVEKTWMTTRLRKSKYRLRIKCLRERLMKIWTRPETRLTLFERSSETRLHMHRPQKLRRNKSHSRWINSSLNSSMSSKSAHRRFLSKNESSTSTLSSCANRLNNSKMKSQKRLRPSTSKQLT